MIGPDPARRTVVSESPPSAIGHELGKGTGHRPGKHMTDAVSTTES